MPKVKSNFLFIILLPIIILILMSFKPAVQKNINRNLKLNSHEKSDTVWIFNGRDLSNLELVLADKTKNLTDFYEIKNGVIYFKAGYKGYLRTKKNYSAFKLHAEWMWPVKNEKGNSGILVGIQSPDSVWPKCIQINFKAKNAGDLIAMNGAKFKEAIGKPKDTALKLSGDSEKPEGEWNSCDIICTGDSMTVYVNNVLQNKATKISEPEGKIGWQLESKPIALRNIYLIK